MSFNAICKQSKGLSPGSSNLLLYNELTKLYTSDISNILENKVNLSSILGYYATTIKTSIENNIKQNFINYINRFVNSYIKHKYNIELENIETKKELYRDIKVLKRDIIENTRQCKIRYHEWLNITKHNLVPSNIC